MNRRYEEPETNVKRTKTKVKRKRKPMSEEQKKAAAERLAKARAKRGVKNASLHESIRDLPDDHYLSPKKVKEWIKVWSEKMRGMRHWDTSKDKDQRREYQIAETYLKNMKSYLQNGIWSDFWYGEHREHKIKYLVVAPAYDENGIMKRTEGYFYRDIGFYSTKDPTDG